MDTNQKFALARSAIYNHDNTTLATLVVENQVGVDAVVRPTSIPDSDWNGGVTCT